MKKLLVFMLMATVVGFSSCTSCGSGKGEETVAQDTTKVDTVAASLTVENTIATGRQYMYNQVGDNYSWYETQVVMKDYLDGETTGEIEEITNVFYTFVMDDETSGDAYVTLLTTTLDGTQDPRIEHGIWVGDSAMNEDSISVTFKDAFDKLMATNLPKPHSKKCTLRNQIGPKNANPQWIFGNIHQCVFVDAVTGEVSDTNPAF